jgi:hypothetical protein
VILSTARLLLDSWFLGANKVLATEKVSFWLVAATRWSLGMTIVSNYEFTLFKKLRFFGQTRLPAPVQGGK